MHDDVQHLLYVKATKLVTAVPQRWISTCNVLEEVLRSWVALEEHYEKNEPGGIFPLAAHETQIEELYSLLKPIAAVMKESQEQGVSTGLSAFVAVVMLRCTTLDVSKPLDVTVPRKVVAATGDTGTTNTTTPSVQRPAASLQAGTTSTRRKLADALDKRFFGWRYNRFNSVVASQPPPAYVFEMAACMSPSFQKLPWLLAMCRSEAIAAKIDIIIKGKVVDLMVRMAEGACAGPAVEKEKAPKVGGEDASSVMSAVPPLKRKAVELFSGGTHSKGKDTERTKKLLASGVFGSGSTAGSDSGGPIVLTMKEVCQDEFQRFLSRFKDTSVADYPTEDLLQFWANEGQALYPNMARVARVLLSVPASSAVLERDFSTAGRLATGAGSRLSGGHAEMVLFLNGNKEYIPAEVPALSFEKGLQAVPTRLSNPSRATETLSVGEVVRDDDDRDEYADETFGTDAESCI